MHAVITEPVCPGALELGWPFRDVIDCIKGGRDNLGPDGTLRGQFLEKDLAESPNQATRSADGKLGN